MAEKENNSLNKETNLSGNASSQIMSRLLKRKSSSGVLLPKIKTKLTKIVSPSSSIKKSYLNVPGSLRRDRIKNFAHQLQSNKTVPTKSTTGKVTNLKRPSFENLDMLLPNGTSMERSSANLSPSALGLPTNTQIGIPEGGQVIAPFNPPADTGNEPSFVARRRARLSAQEEKKGKPTPKKPDASTRPYSRVEEIHPEPRKMSKELGDTKSENLADEKKSVKAEKIVSDLEEDKTKASSKIQSQIQKTSPEQKLEARKTEKTSDNDSVVRRLEDETSRVQRSRENEQVSQKQSYTKEITNNDKKSRDFEINEDLKTLSSKKTFPSIQSGESPQIPNQPKINKEDSNNQNTIRRIESEPSQPYISDKKSVTQQKTIKSEHIQDKKSKDTVEPVSKKRAVEPVSPDKIETPVINEESKTQIHQKNSQDKVAKPQKKVGQEPKTFSDESQKSDLPVLKKSPSSTEGKKPEASPDTFKKITKEEVKRTPEIQKSVSKSTDRTLDQEFEKPEELNADKPIELRAVRARPEDKKNKESSPEKTSDVYKDELKKPILINKKVNQPEPKSFSDDFIKKKKQIFNGLKKPTFKPISEKSQVSAVEKPIVQRQLDTEQQLETQVQSRELKDTNETKASETRSTENQQPDSIRPIDKSSSHISDEQKRIQLSPRNIPERVFRKGLSPRKLDDRTQATKSNLPLQVNRWISPQQKITKHVEVIHPGDLQAQPGQEKRQDDLQLKQTLPSSRPQTIKDRLLVSLSGRKISQRQTKRTNFQQEDLPPVSIQDNLLVSSSGRNTIRRKIEKSIQNVERKPSYEERVTRAIPALPIVKDQRERLAGKSQISQSDSKNQTQVQEQRSKKTQKRTPMPLQSKGPEKERDLELPVVQAKKTEQAEQYFKPDLVVQGPVIQRIAQETDTNDDLLTSEPNESMKLNLEKLAKDVYPIIKRWIAIEKERTSGRLY